MANNNLISNNQHASFLNSFFNIWSENYWDDWGGTGSKLIRGYIGDYTLYPLILPWINVDWHPTDEPHVI